MMILASTLPMMKMKVIFLYKTQLFGYSLQSFKTIFSDSKFFGDDAPLIVGMADDPAPEESKKKLSRSERHRNRNKV